MFSRIGSFFNQIFVKSATFLLLCAISFTCASCTLVSHSPYLAQRTSIPHLKPKQGLIIDAYGELPYQRWSVDPWCGEMRHIWLVGNYDFRRANQVELILYFHGMHAKDYYKDFQRELDLLSQKRLTKPFIFVGYVDTPYVLQERQSKERWGSLLPDPGERPEKLFETINAVFGALRARFPNIKKEKTKITLAGFSGGGKVLDSVGNWLAKADPDDPWANMFRGRLAKIVYFDCWFDNKTIHTIPALLEANPGIQIVGTVHMKKPSENAALLADKYKLKRVHPEILTGLDGRLRIYHDKSHWSAMITRLQEAF